MLVFGGVDSWIIFVQKFHAPGIQKRRKLGSKKRIQRWIASDLSRFFPFHSGMFGGYLSFQKLTSKHLFSGFHRGRNLGPWPSDTWSRYRQIQSTCRSYRSPSLWKELRMLCRYSMIFLQPEWWVFQTNKMVISKIMYTNLNIYIYMYIGLVNIIIIWNTDIMYSQNLWETLVHPECTRKKSSNLMDIQKKWRAWRICTCSHGLFCHSDCFNENRYYNLIVPCIKSKKTNSIWIHISESYQLTSNHITRLYIFWLLSIFKVASHLSGVLLRYMSKRRRPSQSQLAKASDLTDVKER